MFNCFRWTANVTNATAQWVVEPGTAEDAETCRQRCTEYNDGNFVCASPGAEKANGKHIYGCSHEGSDAPKVQCYYSTDHEDYPPYEGFCSYYIDEEYALGAGLEGPFTVPYGAQQKDGEEDLMTESGDGNTYFILEFTSWQAMIGAVVMVSIVILAAVFCLFGVCNTKRSVYRKVVMESDNE